MEFYVNMLANVILEKYFLDSRCLFIFNDNNKFSYNGTLETVNIFVSNGTFDTEVVFRQHGCQGFVVNVGTPVTTILNLEYCIRRSLERFNYRRYLFVPVENQKENPLDIFSYHEMEYIVDIIVMKPIGEVKDDHDKWFKNKLLDAKFYTHKFTGRNKSNEVVVVDEWWSNKTNFLYGNNLYPDKIRDGEGRIFTVSSLTYVPFTVPEANDGVEIRLLVEYCVKYNLTPFVIAQEDPGNWGTIYENWTGEGMLGLVATDDADIACAAIFRWGFMFDYLDLSATPLRSGVSCVAPAPVLAQGWFGPLFPFSYPMWASVGGSLILCSAAFIVIDLWARKMLFIDRSNTEIFQESILNTSAIFLLQGIDDLEGFKNKMKQLVYACMFVFTLLISSSYSSGLASSMTVPRYVGAIKTVQDLVDSGIAWGATSILWISAISEAPEEKYVILRNRFVWINNTTKIPEGKFAYIIEHLPEGYFSFGAKITEAQIQNLRRMLEDIYWEHCIYVTRKSSVWIPTLNNFILRVAQSGIPQLWEYEVAMKYSNPRIQRFVKYSGHTGDNNGPTKLKWGHVQGAFGIWAIGLIFSLTSFIREIYKSRTVILTPAI